MVHGLAALAGVLTLALGGTALAFHGGGVAHCDGCHSMHNSPENPVERHAEPAAEGIGSQLDLSELSRRFGAATTSSAPTRATGRRVATSSG